MLGCCQGGEPEPPQLAELLGDEQLLAEVGKLVSKYDAWSGRSMGVRRYPHFRGSRILLAHQRIAQGQRLRRTG